MARRFPPGRNRLSVGDGALSALSIEDSVLVGHLLVAPGRAEGYPVQEGVLGSFSLRHDANSGFFVVRGVRAAGILARWCGWRTARELVREVGNEVLGSNATCYIAVRAEFVLWRARGGSMRIYGLVRVDEEFSVLWSR